MPRKWLPVFLTLLSLVATSSVAHAWNHIGHWVIASIAFQITRRSDQAEDRGLSQKHPAYADLWSNRETNGPDGVWASSAYYNGLRQLGGWLFSASLASLWKRLVQQNRQPHACLIQSLANDRQICVVVRIREFLSGLHSFPGLGHLISCSRGQQAFGRPILNLASHRSFTIFWGVQRG